LAGKALGAVVGSELSVEPAVALAASRAVSSGAQIKGRAHPRSAQQLLFCT